mmetsp:Transcript_78468/g.127285  ORF Transcript_78468/g.127285 Transcript_78468/m.127285 type:complete len:207 (-) Transcript_78468:94-714(-)
MPTDGMLVTTLEPVPLHSAGIPSVRAMASIVWYAFGRCAAARTSGALTCTCGAAPAAAPPPVPPRHTRPDSGWRMQQARRTDWSTPERPVCSTHWLGAGTLRAPRVCMRVLMTSNGVVASAATTLDPTPEINCTPTCPPLPGGTLPSTRRCPSASASGGRCEGAAFSPAVELRESTPHGSLELMFCGCDKNTFLTTDVSVVTEHPR